LVVFRIFVPFQNGSYKRFVEPQSSEHRLAHGLAPKTLEEFLAELAALMELVEVHFQWQPQSRDPNDEMMLEAAINGRADALVTYNVADFAGPAERFRISPQTPKQTHIHFPELFPDSCCPVRASIRIQ
jgi:predicted nucleic acid-binding protein